MSNVKSRMLKFVYGYWKKVSVRTNFREVPFAPRHPNYYQALCITLYYVLLYFHYPFLYPHLSLYPTLITHYICI